jgi:hypothetical protein
MTKTIFWMKQIFISIILLIFFIPIYLIGQNDNVLNYMVDNAENIVQGQVLFHRCEMNEVGVTTCYYNIRVDSVIKGSLDLEPITFRVDSLINQLEPTYPNLTNCLTDSARNNPYLFDEHTLNSENRIGVIRTLVWSWPITKSSPLYKSIIEVAHDNGDCIGISNCKYYIFFLNSPLSNYPIFSTGSYKYKLISADFGVIKANPYLFKKIHEYMDK